GHQAWVSCDSLLRPIQPLPPCHRSRRPRAARARHAGSHGAHRTPYQPSARPPRPRLHRALSCARAQLDALGPQCPGLRAADLQETPRAGAGARSVLLGSMVWRLEGRRRAAPHTAPGADGPDLVGEGRLEAAWPDRARRGAARACLRLRARAPARAARTRARSSRAPACAPACPLEPARAPACAPAACPLEPARALAPRARPPAGAGRPLAPRARAPPWPARPLALGPPRTRARLRPGRLPACAPAAGPLEPARVPACAPGTRAHLCRAPACA